MSLTLTLAAPTSRSVHGEATALAATTLDTCTRHEVPAPG